MYYVIVREYVRSKSTTLFSVCGTSLKTSLLTDLVCCFVSCSVFVTLHATTSRVVKHTFLKYLKYKIVLRNVFEILLSNTSTQRSKIQNTCSRLYLKYKIHKLEVTIHS